MLVGVALAPRIWRTVTSPPSSRAVASSILDGRGRAISLLMAMNDVSLLAYSIERYHCCTLCPPHDALQFGIPRQVPARGIPFRAHAFKYNHPRRLPPFADAPTRDDDFVP